MLKFTPLEFETTSNPRTSHQHRELKFTPLEFETNYFVYYCHRFDWLKFTPLEFETRLGEYKKNLHVVKIYSVGV